MSAGHLRPSPVEEPLDRERRPPNHRQQRHEVAEEADAQPDAVRAEEVRLCREQRQHGAAPEHADERDSVAELHLSPAVAVDVVDVPAEQRAEAEGARQLEVGRLAHGAVLRSCRRQTRCAASPAATPARVDAAAAPRDTTAA